MKGSVAVAFRLFPKSTHLLGLTTILKCRLDARTKKESKQGMQFISSKASMQGYAEGESIVLGPSTIGAKTLLGMHVIVGYPARKKIQAFPFSRSFKIEKLDSVSDGTKIGNNCILRSGTIVYETATLGNSVETGHNALIREGCTIGDRTRIGSGSQLDGAVRVGKDVSIQSNVYLPHLTVIEDDVFLGPNVVVTNDPYPPSKRRIGVTIEKGAAIGANSCIVVPARVGTGSIVGAGAVVTTDVPSNMVVIGAPAKPYITRTEYNKKRTKWEKGAR
jgi:acetyltransferase-like isoleucine patch superfamily enzyme